MSYLTPASFLAAMDSTCQPADLLSYNGQFYTAATHDGFTLFEDSDTDSSFSGSTTSSTFSTASFHPTNAYTPYPPTSAPHHHHQPSPHAHAHAHAIQHAQPQHQHHQHQPHPHQSQSQHHTHHHAQVLHHLQPTHIPPSSLNNNAHIGSSVGLSAVSTPTLSSKSLSHSHSNTNPNAMDCTSASNGGSPMFQNPANGQPITYHYFCNFPTCDYHSARSDPVKRHRDTHYPDYKPYTCNYCQASSARRDSTREHCLKQHKDDSENAFRYDSTIPKPEGWIAYEPKRCPWPPVMV